MGNVIKAQLYQLKKSSLLYVVFVCVGIMQITVMMGEIGFDFSLCSAGKYVAEDGESIAFISLIFALVLTGYVCGADFNDKTANYELMSGHLRKEIYFGRAVISLFLGALGTLVLNALPVVVACVMGEFGDTLSVGDVFVRYILSVLPVLRLICEFVFLSYIVKNGYVVMALGVVLAMAGQAWVDMFPNGTAKYMAISNLAELLRFPAWETYTLVGEKSIVVYDGVLGAGDILGTIVSSVVIGGLFLLLGYLFFNRDDMN